MRVLILVVCSLLLIGICHTRRVQNKKPVDDEDVYGDLNDEDANDDDGVQNDENDEVNYFDVPNEIEREEQNGTLREEMPKLLSTDKVFVAQLGDSFALACKVTQDPTVLWKKGDKVLYQAGLELINVENVKLAPNGSLVVNVRRPEDYGDYICEVAIDANNSPQVTYRIVPPTPPKIHFLNTVDGEKILKPGSTLTLRCNATGYPKPTISWHKDNERLGTEGETLVIPDVKLKTAGTYACLADNDVNPPAHEAIEIFVDHKPVVYIEKYLVNSNHESDAELKCIVHGYPAPAINWQRNGSNLYENQKIKLTVIQKSRSIEKILTIKDLSDEDFGDYRCVAINTHGRDAKNVRLVKTPAVREFEKPQKGSKDVVLTWRVESKSEIKEHELQYRKQGEDEWVTISPEVTKGENNVYTIKHPLKGLEPGKYETRVRSRNSHGWSDYSDPVPFEGVVAKHGSHHKHHNKKQQKEKDMKVLSHTESPDTPAPPELHQKSNDDTSIGESKTSGCTSVTSSMFALSISVLLMLLCRK